MFSRYRPLLDAFAASSIMLLFFAFGLYHIERFETADEHYWISERVPQYWQALASERYHKTFINDKPGVSVALLSGIALPFVGETTYYTPLSQSRDTLPVQLPPEETLRLFFAFRLPLLVFNTFLIGYFFWALRTLFQSRFVATVGTLSIAFTPALVGITHIVNPDALLWSTGFAATLSFLLLIREHTARFIFPTALFFALALLSKYTAMVLIPIFVIITILHAFLIHSEEQKLSSPSNPLNIPTSFLKNSLLKDFFFLVISLFLAAIFTSLLLPAILINPKKFLDLTLGFSSSMTLVLWSSLALAITAIIVHHFTATREMLRCALETILLFSGRLLFLTLLALSLFLVITRNTHDPNVLATVPFDIKNIGILTEGFSFFDLTLLEYNPFVFSLPPLILALMLWALATHTFSRTNTARSRLNFFFVCCFALPLLIIPIGYLLADTVATVRYLILLYPFAAVLAALGAHDVFLRLRDRFHSGLAFVFLGVISLSLLFSLFTSLPFSLAYTSALLPKDKVITDAWGYGGYEAAQYLNAQPNAEKLIIWTDYAGVCPFFRGVCILDNVKFNRERHPIDYFVISRRGMINLNPAHPKWSDSKNVPITPIYAEQNPEWQLLLSNRPKSFVRVVKAKE